ncbi:MAG: 50S ribosomal protein L10 [Deltaproteobacteria bacterium]|nr:50S ribosomal protein L10 [Deltaproteobacteria bacterium]
MKKDAKVALVGELQEKFARAGATFVAEYKGIKAVEMNELRKAMRAASVDFKIVRNTLARRAVKGTGLETISGDLKGSTAVAFSYKDAAGAAKLLVQFAKDQPKLQLRMGTLGTQVIGLAEIKGLAELPPREALLAKLFGSMKSPSSGLVCVLSGVSKKFVRSLNAIREQKAAAVA